MKILMKNISKEYIDGSEKLEALKNINLSISDNEFIAIIGPSGSGKSTLLNIIGMIDQQYKGEYMFNNISIIKYNEDLSKIRNKYFGYVFQNYGLIKNISVYKNIKIPLDYIKISKKELKNKIDNVLNKLNLRDKADSYPNNMSGGQCQKVAIARAIVNDSEIILADEPTASLDKNSRDTVIEIFLELYKSGKTIILVTHDLKITKYCTRIIEMEDGKIIKDYKNRGIHNE